jgi:hypothetical protein
MYLLLGKKHGLIDNNTAQKTPVYYIFIAVQLRFAMLWRIRSGIPNLKNYTASWSGCLHLLSCVGLTVLGM